MKKLTITKALAVVLLALPLSFTACIKDTCKKAHTYTYYKPLYRTKDEVRANIKSNAPRAIENPGKLNIYGNYIFLNEVNKGVHVINNTNPASPVNMAFIDIPGNIDIAIKGNILYADLYTDLVAMDISNPSGITVKKIIDFLFPERQYGGDFVAVQDKVIVEWERVDTTIIESCDEPFWGGPVLEDVLFFSPTLANVSAGSGSSQVGIGGSMARFTIVNNYMYTVDRHMLKAVSISNPADPVLAGSVYAGSDIETIYPFKNTLFLGSMNGLFIYDISNPATPVKQGVFTHARACDPVVADDKYALVTLRSGTNCGPAADELLVINVENLQAPYLVKTYPMTNPFGLSKDHNMLFVCDGTGGLKTYDATDLLNLKHVKTLDGIDTYDVIAFNSRAVVVAKGGLYQYDYSNFNDIRLLSRIAVKK